LNKLPISTNSRLSLRKFKKKHEEEVKQFKEQLERTENSITPMKGKLQAEISELKSKVEKAVHDKEILEAAMRKLKAQETITYKHPSQNNIK